MFGVHAIAGPSRPANAQDVSVAGQEIRLRLFESPVYVEVSVDKVFAVPPGEKWTTREAGLLEIDGIRVGELALSVTPGQKGRKDLLEVKLRCANVTRQDRELLISMEGLDGPDVISLNHAARRLEQGDSGWLSGILPLEFPEKWARTPRPKVKLKLAVKTY